MPSPTPRGYGRPMRRIALLAVAATRPARARVARLRRRRSPTAPSRSASTRRATSTDRRRPGVIGVTYNADRQRRHARGLPVRGLGRRRRRAGAVRRRAPTRRRATRASDAGARSRARDRQRGLDRRHPRADGDACAAPARRTSTRRRPRRTSTRSRRRSRTSAGAADRRPLRADHGLGHRADAVHEYVTINRGAPPPANLIYSDDNGFSDNIPFTFDGRRATGRLTPATVNANYVDKGPADHGARFTFSFGTLAAGRVEAVLPLLRRRRHRGGRERGGQRRGARDVLLRPARPRPTATEPTRSRRSRPTARRTRSSGASAPSAAPR